MEIEKQKYTAKTFTKRYYESIIQQMEGKVDILDSVMTALPLSAFSPSLGILFSE